MGFRKMRFNDKRTAKNLVCGLAVLTVCSASVLSGCAGGDDASSQEKDTAPQEQTQELQKDPDGQADAGNKALGDFTMQDINGETYTQEMFGDHDLTKIGRASCRERV